MIWSKLKFVIRNIFREGCNRYGCRDLRECQFVELILVNKDHGIIMGKGMIGLRCERCLGVDHDGLRYDGTSGDLSEQDWAHEVVSHHKLGNGDSVVIFHHEFGATNE